MSYRVAYVRFTRRGDSYPTNCHRSDLEHNDLVVVKMGGQHSILKVALVDRVEFLNWHCRNTVICKRSEYHSNGKGSFRIDRISKPRGIETIEELVAELRHLGWQDFRCASNVYKQVVVKRFSSSTAAIGVRRNGIDFQLFYNELDAVPDRFPHGTDNLVRHNFHASGISLLDFCKDFALSAEKSPQELGIYFKSLGEKQPRPKHIQDDIREIRGLLRDSMTDAERDALG
jgi:hypothetical protein